MFWSRKDRPEKAIESEEILRPGICECGCLRCSHEKGKGRCHSHFPPDREWPQGSTCACQVYIRDHDDDKEPEPETPTPSELEKIYQM